MTSDRGSYRKTTALAAVVVAGGASLLAVALVALTRTAGWPMIAAVGLTASVVLIGIATAWATLVTGGGLIALRRDRLEEAGLPYAPPRRRESVAGPFRQWLLRVFHAAGRAGRMPPRPLGLRPGEWVEVRQLDEILATLDENGTLGGVPFMPEMAAYCGRRARVFRRIDKLNDWIRGTGLKRMHDLVLLTDIRCSGSAHGGCQANCHIRWSELWLRRSRPDATPPTAEDRPDRPAVPPRLSQLASHVDADGDTIYRCQATELTTGAAPMAWGDPRHYLRELWYGNIRIRPFLTGVAIACFNWVQRRRGGARFPSYRVGESKTSPHESLNLQPGERVRVKPKHRIEPTLNSISRNRGLYFDRDMLRCCGAEFTVKARLERVIVEKTGKMIQLTTPCIVLERVTATGEYLGFNPENEHIFWREIWLERVAPRPESAGIPA